MAMGHKKRIFQWLFVLSSPLWYSKPCYAVYPPECLSQCDHGCNGGHCFPGHACVFKNRILTMELGQYKLICRFRGGFRRDEGGQYFCCGHSYAEHDHVSFWPIQQTPGRGQDQCRHQ
jgi:hypothetical protein